LPIADLKGAEKLEKDVVADSSTSAPVSFSGFSSPLKFEMGNGQFSDCC
jgi:hypothetical protein